MIFQRTLTAAIMLAAGASSQSAIAIECGDQSLLAKAKGDDYYILGQLSQNNVPQSIDFKYNAIDQINSSLRHTDSQLKRNAKQLNLLLHALNTTTFKHGNGVRYECIGLGSNMRVEAMPFELEDIEHVSMLNGVELIKAFEAYENENLIRTGRMDMPASSTWMTNATMDELSSTLVFRQRFKTDNQLYPHLDGNGYVTPIVELETRVKVLGRSIELSQHKFIGGYRDGWVVWRLGS